MRNPNDVAPTARPFPFAPAQSGATFGGVESVGPLKVDAQCLVMMMVTAVVAMPMTMAADVEMNTRQPSGKAVAGSSYSYATTFHSTYYAPERTHSLVLILLGLVERVMARIVVTRLPSKPAKTRSL
jgi:hypothetical protein